MKKKLLNITAAVLCLVTIFAMSSCQSNNLSDNNASSKKSEATGQEASEQDTAIELQRDLTEPKKLQISENGTVTVEIDTLAKKDTSALEDKAIFLVVNVKDDTDIALRYTYDSYGEENIMLCCGVNDSDTDETALKPIYAMNLTQSSEENYKEIWFGGGAFLEKGANCFYLSGRSRSLPCRMVLELTFFEKENVESVVLYPAEK